MVTSPSLSLVDAERDGSEPDGARESDRLQAAIATAAEMVEQLGASRGMAPRLRELLSKVRQGLMVADSAAGELGQWVAVDELLAGFEAGSLAGLVEDDGSVLSRVSGQDIEDRRGELLVVDRMMRGGAEPLAATVFLDRGFELSRALGDEVRILGHWLRAAVASLSHGDRHVACTFPAGADVREVRGALKRLRDLGVLDKSPGVFRRGKGNAPVQATTRVTDDAGIQQLLSGHWLSSYARWLVEDHAKKNEVPAQVVSRLEVAFPRDTSRRGHVEYDLLALLDRGPTRRLLQVECKAGSLDNIRVQEIAEARDAMAEAASIFSGDALEIESICLVPDVVTNNDRKAEAGLRKALDEEGIQLLTLGELRAFVHDRLTR